MRATIIAILILLSSCVNKEREVVACCAELSETRKAELKKEIDDGDKESARKFLEENHRSYSHQEDFKYIVEAFDLSGKPQDIYTIVGLASSVDDIYACKEVFDFLSRPSLLDEQVARQELAGLWCSSLWSNPEFSKGASKR